MNGRKKWWAGLAGCVVLVLANFTAAQDWPQWRGPNRDAKAVGFHAPASWPNELTKKWQITVGNGVSTPALVGDRLFVFSREDDNEVTRCLNAATGEEIWQDKYASEGPTGGASNFPGPRSSPTVSDGKVLTLGVRGILSCFDAASGKLLWRKDDFTGAWPQFFAASSPIVVDGLCIAELGGPGNGGIIGYDLTSGNEKWKWTEDGPAYASPVVITVDGRKLILTPTEKNLVAVDPANGKLVWQIPYAQGRLNAVTPIVDGQTIILAGPGTGVSALGVAKKGDELAEEQLWNNTDNSLQFNTPVLKDGLMYGVAGNGSLFCINAQSHATLWSAPIGKPPEGGQVPGGPGGGERGDRGGRGGGGQGGQGAPGDQAAGETPASGQTSGGPSAGPQPENTQAGDGPPGEGRGRGGDGDRRGRGGRGGRGGGGGYGSVVDAGSVLMALTPSSELVVFPPSDSAFTELAKYKVADTPTHAYPVVSGNRVFVKDQNSVMLWTVE